MSKPLRILLLLISLSVATQAQRGEFFRNSQLSLAAAPNYYLNNVGVGADLSFSKWLHTAAGLRVEFSFALAGSNGGGLEPYYCPHVDIFFDPLTALRGRNTSDVWRLYFDVGFGLVRCTGDNDFFLHGGLGADRRIGRDWRLFAELSAMVFPSDFAGQTSPSLLPRLALGVTYDIANNPTRSRSRFETRDFGYDWFFQLAVGACSFRYSGIGSWSDRLNQLTPIFDFGLGKRITTLWGARLCVSGLYAKSSEEVFTYYDIRGDLMFHLIDWILPNRETPVLDFVPYAGGSVLSRLDDRRNFMITAAMGALISLNVYDRNELYLDFRYLQTPSRFAHISTPQTLLSVGMTTLSLGYCYHFGRRSL